jgi:tRNA nucleotidyltransferase (CCA-adding enzyme)
MLLHDIGKPKTRTTDKNGTDHFYFHQRLSKSISESVLKRLKFDNRSANYILRLVEFHDNNPGNSHEAVRKALSIIGSDIFPDLLKVKEADLRAQNPDFFNAGYEKLQRLKSIYMDIMEKQQCISLDSLAVNGNDLINLGFVPGKEIGLLLQRLLDEVIERPELNTKDRLIDLLKNIS